MYLRRLELQGFKTFAQKTVLEFQPRSGKERGLTAIVGPNGSGKSNVADAIRWVMGEQSLKLLRSKKSEDVIFSGTDKRSRSGFAEVNMTLENDTDLSDVDMKEIVITRRLYRDGQSDYLVNNQTVRLTDVTLLLAQCGVGQRTYSVIGQGMVDAVLSASPAERKEFFDEAAGLRVFQLKRTQAMNKLDGTRTNLQQADLLLREIEPRLHTLEKQVKRLREREGIEEELRRVERATVGRSWGELRLKLSEATKAHEQAEKAWSSKNAEAESLEAELGKMEKAAPVSHEVEEARAALDALRDERTKLREEVIRLESKKEIAAVRSEKPWSPLPLSKIIEEIGRFDQGVAELEKLIEAKEPNMSKIREAIANIKTRNADLLGRLQRPAPEPEREATTDAKLEREAHELAARMSAMGDQIQAAERSISELAKKDEQGRLHLFEVQRKLTAKRHEAQTAERRVSETSVDLARIETRRDGFLTELRAQSPALETELNTLADAEHGDLAEEPIEKLQAKLHRLRSQLEWIGGIDPATLTEYDETAKRFETLRTQAEDLRQAIAALETVITELDQTIEERSNTAFEKLNREFNAYFQKLFGGGEASIIQLEAEPVTEESEEEDNTEHGTQSTEHGIVGIDLHATPPGKRLKSIALLSGGERALTSIALICAIMATNPSPFVVLDEVDAALDESNSKKFADIIEALSAKTQFAVITHNRATMHAADVLYGVTMGDDGTSQVLSVKLGSEKA